MDVLWFSAACEFLKCQKVHLYSLQMSDLVTSSTYGHLFTKLGKISNMEIHPLNYGLMPVKSILKLI